MCLQDYLQTNQSELSIPEDAEGEINSVYTALTKNSVDREINYNEFVAAVMWRRIQYDEEKMRMVFEALDVNRQGYLTAESIRQVVRGLSHVPNACPVDLMPETTRHQTCSHVRTVL